MQQSSKKKAETSGKREKILLAAVDMFLEKDFYQVTITEIADQAGVGKGTVYEYFSSKEVLFKECFSYCADSYLRLFKENHSEASSVKESMFNIVNTHLELIKDNQNKLHLLFNERPLSFQELQTWVAKRRDELLEGVTELIKEGIEQREIRADIDVDMAGRLFLALNWVVLGGMVIIDDIDVEDKQHERIFDVFWNGVCNLQESTGSTSLSNS